MDVGKDSRKAVKLPIGIESFEDIIRREGFYYEVQSTAGVIAGSKAAEVQKGIIRRRDEQIQKRT